MLDWLAAAAIFAVMMIVIFWGWRTFPHPRENGGLILGAVAVVSTLLFFAKSKTGLPLWPRALGFAALVLAAQFGLQALTYFGFLRR